MMENCPTILNTTLADLDQFWQEHIKLKQESGLSRSAYCRKYNLVCSRFAYWERKLKAPTTKLLPVILNPTITKPAFLCTLILKNGNQIQIHDSAVLPVILSILS